MGVESRPEDLSGWLSSPSDLRAMSAADQQTFAEVLHFCEESGQVPGSASSDRLEENAYRALCKLRDQRKCVGQTQLSVLADSIAEGTKAKTAKSMWLLPPMDSTLSSQSPPVRRTGFQATHAMFLTSTSSQGQTLRSGVTIDCARKEKTSLTCRQGMDDDVWWLHLYVMLSRATRRRPLLMKPVSSCLWQW